MAEMSAPLLKCAKTKPTLMSNAVPFRGSTEDAPPRFLCLANIFAVKTLVPSNRSSARVRQIIAFSVNHEAVLPTFWLYRLTNLV